MNESYKWRNQTVKSYVVELIAFASKSNLGHPAMQLFPGWCQVKKTRDRTMNGIWKGRLWGLRNTLAIGSGEGRHTDVLYHVRVNLLLLSWVNLVNGFSADGQCTSTKWCFPIPSSQHQINHHIKADRQTLPTMTSEALRQAIRISTKVYSEIYSHRSIFRPSIPFVKPYGVWTKYDTPSMMSLAHDFAVIELFGSYVLIPLLRALPSQRTNVLIFWSVPRNIVTNKGSTQMLKHQGTNRSVVHFKSMQALSQLTMRGKFCPVARSPLPMDPLPMVNVYVP